MEIDRAFTEVTALKLGHWGCTLSNLTVVLIKGEIRTQRRRKAVFRYREKAASTRSTDALISDFWPPEP